MKFRFYTIQFLSLPCVTEFIIETRLLGWETSQTYQHPYTFTFAKRFLKILIYFSMADGIEDWVNLKHCITCCALLHNTKRSMTLYCWNLSNILSRTIDNELKCFKKRDLFNHFLNLLLRSHRSNTREYCDFLGSELTLLRIQCLNFCCKSISNWMGNLYC